MERAIAVKRGVALAFKVLFGVVLTLLCMLFEMIYWIFPRPKRNLNDDVVVVTGAGHGLGRCLAAEFGNQGAFVVCLDKIPAELNRTVWHIRQEGGRSQGYTCDVHDPEKLQQIAVTVRREVGPVNMLVCCAGIYPIGPILEWDNESLGRLLQANIMATYWSVKAYLPDMMLRNKGHVVAISSISAVAPVAFEVPYSASKCAVAGLMEGLQQELRLTPHNKIRVSCVYPYLAWNRYDLPFKLNFSLSRLTPTKVAHDIVKGIREGREDISIPSTILFWMFLLRCFPQRARRYWRNIIYYRVPGIEVVAPGRPDSVNIIVEEQEDTYQLPPVPLPPMTTIDAGESSRRVQFNEAIMPRRYNPRNTQPQDHLQLVLCHRVHLSSYMKAYAIPPKFLATRTV